jgi:hypothetical protein
LIVNGTPKEHSKAYSRFRRVVVGTPPARGASRLDQLERAVLLVIALWYPCWLPAAFGVLWIAGVTNISLRIRREQGHHARPGS